MGKAPASQFYWGDLRRDTEYHLMDWASRGIWVEMLSCMHFSKERGKLNGSPEQLSRLLGCTLEEFQKAKIDISVTKTGDVTESNGFVTIINRRMFREERERILTRCRVQKYRNTQEKRVGNEEVTPPSSSSSPSPTPKNKTYSSFFLSFWKEYPKKIGKPNAFREWNKIKPDLEIVLSALKVQIEYKESLMLENKFCPEWPDPERWIKNQRWLDEISEGRIEDRRMWEIEQLRRKKDEHS